MPVAGSGLAPRPTARGAVDPSGGAAPPAVAWTAPPRVPGRLRQGLSGTPGTMRVLTVFCLLAAVVFSLFGALSINARSDALHDMQTNAEQLVRVQTIRVDLVAADAAATNSFLQGGLESPTLREAYLAKLASASRGVAEASAGAPEDAAELSAVNDRLTTYAGLVETARANNRQGFPVGAAYLRQAHVLLNDSLTDPARRDDVLTRLGRVVEADQARIDAAYESSQHASTSLWIVAGFAALPMLAAQGWLFFRTRRWVNVGMAIATVVILGGAAGAAVVMAQAQADATSVRRASLAATVNLAQARADAFAARSDESLTLINRGSGQPYEKSWTVAMDSAVRHFEDAARGGAATGRAFDALASYRSRHTEARALDDKGDWDQAVGRVTDPDGDLTAAFGRFDAESARLLGDQARAVSSSLADARLPLDIARWLVALAGVVAMVATSLGMARRLREYR